MNVQAAIGAAGVNSGTSVGTIDVNLQTTVCDIDAQIGTVIRIRGSHRRPEDNIGSLNRKTGGRDNHCRVGRALRSSQGSSRSSKGESIKRCEDHCGVGAIEKREVGVVEI